jgi:hypothetical protein
MDFNVSAGADTCRCDAGRKNMGPKGQERGAVLRKPETERSSGFLPQGGEKGFWEGAGTLKNRGGEPKPRPGGKGKISNIEQGILNIEIRYSKFGIRYSLLVIFSIIVLRSARDWGYL